MARCDLSLNQSTITNSAPCAHAVRRMTQARSQWIRTMRVERQENQWFATFVAVASLLTVVGCGGTFESSVSGVVTLDGKVVPRGAVSFQPKAGGPAAYAQINEDGSYVVRTG